MHNKNLKNLINELYGLPNIFSESNDDFSAEFFVPGLELSQIAVKASPSKLSITAEATREQEARGIYGFSYDFSFPYSADLNNTKAELNLGILKIIVPKKADGGSKKIAIKCS